MCRKLRNITVSDQFFVLYPFIRCARNDINCFLSIVGRINSMSRVKEILIYLWSWALFDLQICSYTIPNSFSSKNVLITITLLIWEIQLKIIFRSVLYFLLNTVHEQKVPPLNYENSLCYKHHITLSNNHQIKHLWMLLLSLIQSMAVYLLYLARRSATT